MSFSFSYDFNLDLTPAATIQPADLYVADAAEFHPLADGQSLAVNTRTGQRVIIRDNVLLLLGLCDRFRTLAEHRDLGAENLTGQGISAGEILAVLEDLKTAGLLVSAEQWLARFPADSAAKSDPSDWALVIATCDRPMLLQRLLDSTVAHITDEVRPAQVLLIDDSRQSESRSANRRAWVDWLARCRLSGEYWDRDARVHLCNTLMGALPDAADTVNRLLSPEAFPGGSNTVGQVRNLALLLTAGRRLLLLDDDCCLVPQWHTSLEPSLGVGAVPTEVIPYADRGELESDVQPLALNPFAEHLRLLGVTLRQGFDQLAQSWGDVGWLRALDAATLRRLSPESRIRLTVNAVLGDPGTGSLHWLYNRPAESAVRVAAYLQRFSPGQDIERLFWKGRSRHLLSFDEPLMTTTLTGIDNRLLVPGVLPVGRGEDLLLGTGLRMLHPEAMLLAFNWALPHRPDPARYWQRPVAGATPSTPEPGWLAEKMLDHVLDDCTLRKPGARLEALVACCEDLATVDDPLLTRLLESRYLAHHAAHLMGYTRAASQAKGEHWQQDLSTLIEAANQQIGQPLALSSAWLAEFRSLISHYANALLLWPALRQQMVRDGDDPVGGAAAIDGYRPTVDLE